VNALRRPHLVVAAVVIPVLVAACAPPPAPPDSSTTASTTTSTVPQVVMSVGHADIFEVTVSGAALSVQIKDASVSPAVYRSPAQTLLQVRPSAQTTVPSPSGNFAFLGPAGAPVWILPQAQNPDLLWPGTSTERIGSGVLHGNAVAWHIDSVSGPGSMHVYTTDGFGVPTVLFTTGSAFPQSRSLGVPSHAHHNWAFGAVGTYTVVMRATATLANGSAVTSGPIGYTFRVGAL
jgi:surface-anchored protein